MSLLQANLAGLGGSGAAGGALGGTSDVFSHTINQSLRFNRDDNPKLALDPTGSPTLSTKCTISFWFKLSKLGTSQYLFTGETGNVAYDVLQFHSTNKIQVLMQNPNSYGLRTTAVFRDVGAWYHLVLECDSTLSTAADRFKLYINGDKQTLTSVYGNYPLDHQWYWSRSGASQNIGRSENYSNSFHGYIAEFNFVDGQALDPTSFGETSDGVWVPKEYSGTYGNNGFHLTFADSNYLGRDKSGSKTLVTSTSFSTFGGGDTNFSSTEYAEAFDNDLSTTCDRTGNGGIIEFTPSASVTPTSHTMINAPSSAYSAASRPNSVLLQGSNDGGGSWTTIDDLTNGSGSGTATTSSFSNSTSYAKLRLNISENHGGSNTRFGQYLVFASDDNGDGENVFFRSNLDSTDVVLDSPTNNFCTWNAAQPQGAAQTSNTLTQGNLKAANSASAYGQSMGSMSVLTGKWYTETYIENAGYPSWHVGWTYGTRFEQFTGGTNDDEFFAGFGYFTGSNVYFSSFGTSYAALILTHSSVHTAGDAPTTGDVIGCAADFDNGKFWWHINGEYLNVGSGAGDPANDSNPAQTFTVATYADNYKSPWVMNYNGSFILNAGQDGTFAGNITAGGNSDGNGIGNFKYAVPNGFLALCSSNLPDITVGPGQTNQADDFFDTILYSGSDFTDLHIGAGGARHPQDTITIANSLKFDDGSSPELYKSWLQDATDRKHFTVAFWIKRSTLGTQQTMLQCDTSGGQATQIIFDTSDKLRFNVAASGTGQRRLITTRTFKNISSFYHIVCAYDSEASTSTERARIYVNGIEETSFDTDERSSIAGTDVHGIMENGQSVNTIGFRDHSNVSKNFLDAYLCDYHCIDGQTLGPESFGQVGANGDWIPKAYSGSYGNNGFRLTFQTAAYPEYDYQTSDRSKTNDFTKAGLAATDQTIDSPTQNFSTLDSKRYSNIGAFSEGNLTITTSTNQTAAYGTIAVPSSGKWYYEVHADNYVISAGSYFGWGTDVNLGDNENGLSKGIQFSNYNEQVLLDGTGQSGGYGVTTNDIGADGDVFSILLDVDNGLFYYAKNGTYFNSANPSNGTGGLGVSDVLAAAVTAVHPMIARGGSSAETYTFNFGQDASFNGQKTAPATDKTDSNGVGKFLYDVPTGFLALMDDNIPQEGVISPDFVWIKKRSGTAQHYLFDTVRGAGKDLHSDDDDPEVSSVETLKSFDSQGFTVGLTTDINDKDTTYAAWTWKAGGPAPTQTYEVTVSGDSGSNKYRFDGNTTDAPTLTLQQGGTYTFDQSDSSNAVGGVHPLRFSTTSDGTHGGGSEYTVGVTTTGTPGTTGAKTVITVAWGAPTLYYYCTQHSGMGGQVNTIETRGSSNLKGSIPSIVSANTTAGFSIVSFTGNSTNPSTIGHGLSSAPEMIIYKSREAANGTWYVGHDDIGWTDRLKLDTNTTPAASSALWNNTAPTNSVFTISSSLNYNGEGIIAYCFHSVDGYCKVGSYIGNGSSSDGTFSYTGFRPAWLLVKTISSSNRWVLFDSARSTTNPIEEKHELNPDDTSSEGTSGTDCFDFLSNGFKVRRTGDVFNTTGHSYIYLAFAEAPFKFSNAR